MTDVPFRCLTVSASHRQGAEVLLNDAGPLPNLAAVREAPNEINSALDPHADLLFEHGAELIICVAEWRLQRHYQPLTRRQERVAPQGDF